MTDLTRGIIEFEEMTVTPSTTKADLMKVYGDKLSPTSCKTAIKFIKSFLIDNHKFSCWFYLDVEEKVKSIKMTPHIDYKSENWDRTGQQEERRQFCDKWLFERLGDPHKVLSGDIEYTFTSHKISCFSNNDIRNGGSAGYIVVTYK